MRRYNRIMFLIPNFRWLRSDNRTIWNNHPYGLCMIASSLKDTYDVSIVDANFYNLSTEELKERLKEFKPDVVGISILTSEYSATGHYAARLIKEFNRDVAVVLGGVYGTTQWHEINDNHIDYLFVGEGEVAFREFIDKLNGKRDQLSSGSLTRNLFNIQVVKADAVNNLNELPLPSYELINYRDYTITSPRESVDEPQEYPYGRIMTSRGCPLNCIFCQVDMIMGKTFRKRTPENIIREIDYLIERYSVKYLIFDDDNLFLDKRRAINLFNMMTERRYNLKWHPIATAVYALDERVLNAARKSGLQYVDLAIESGVKRVLKDIIDKPVNLDHAKKIVNLCRTLGINTAVNFIIGFPGETWDEIRQTLKFAEEINADYCKIFIANPLSGTGLYKLADQTGSLISDRTENTWFLGRIRTEEFSPEDLAILRAYEWDRINFSTQEKKEKIASMMRVSTDRLDEIRKETFRKAREIMTTGSHGH